ncbi:hypothetical protein IGB42_03566 [Andreprevotia sp. IGB-42]|uniref:hypothetical protein n=1 Tax=Andreprevotia sp. IGB-42 TaxID=2497473 RepID=UPI00135C8910|nr:hypothetical protein [Andreprevotia sp. IGB-42]KAF0812024.1 hypothetical protein IGB42_03566 [Andreprevotia sp. IGB-42]
MSIIDFLFVPSQRRYAALLQAKLRALGDTRPWQYHADREQLALPAAQNGRPAAAINLGTLYAEFRAASRWQRGTMLEAAAHGQLQANLPGLYADARARLLPVVRPAAERGLSDLQLDSQLQLAFQPLCADLEINLVYDTEHAMARISGAQLADWGVSFEAAYQDALLNLRERSTQALEDLGGAFRTPYEDCYDAARLLLTDVLHRLPLDGAPVVMIPNRSILLVTGENNLPALAAILETATTLLDQPRPLSPLMLRLGSQGWENWQPAAHASALRLLRIRSDGSDYATQKQLLERQFERDGIDVFVASYTGMYNEQGEAISYCVWTEGVHALLPQTDLISFQLPEGGVLQVPWHKVAANAGQLLQATSYAPVRHEVTAYPAPAQIRQWAQAEETAVV